MIVPDPTVAEVSVRPLWRRVLPDALALGWLVLIGLLYLLPALSHGVFIGTYDLLSKLGLSKQPGVIVHNGELWDQIDSMIPWTNLAWMQVHAGHLPLWNPFNGLGLPLAFNWQSAPFSLPSAVGYLVPLRYAYDVGIALTLIIAGSGAYVFGRVLGLGALASAMAGTVFELSGPMTGWLGFPHAAVMSWAGWWFAATVLILNDRHRLRAILLLAVTIGLAIYAGQPEVLIVFLAALALFVGVILALRLEVLRGSGPIFRPLRDIILAGIAGLGLGAPLLLPGLQLASLSVRSSANGTKALSFHDLMYLASQGFDGLPIAGSRIFGDSFFYNESVAYVGVIALVLAGVAAIRLRRRPEVAALVAVVVVAGAVVFVEPLALLVRGLPVVGTVQWNRALMPLALALAALAAFGIDLLATCIQKKRGWVWFAGGFGTMGLILALVFLVGRGDLASASAHIRVTSFYWPAIGVAAGLTAAFVLAVLQRRTSKDSEARLARTGACIAAVLIATEAGFLITAGAPIVSSSKHTVTATVAETQLQKAVGTARVGFGAGQCGQMGIDPSVNSILGVRELDAYDPTIPQAYFSSWSLQTGTSGGLSSFNLYCPRVTSTAIARLYGLKYLLEPGHAAGPMGSIFVKVVGDETLFRIPAAAVATLVPLTTPKKQPATTAVGSPVPVAEPNPTTWTMRTSSTEPGMLRLRLTDLPGWEAKIDGKPLALRRFAGVMLEARIPPGDHTIELNYWPTTFTIGLAAAGISALGLIFLVIVDRRSRRRVHGKASVT